ncbi:RNA-binding domain-containing protein [Exidia glandulosa HHB12029]|uniref:RNA-binding domain-containing protein n=1 Tax=Exidia glandulosa HHB12029 TaxID=1314781 RepID=A0A165QM09_EXIGL|nr:RNA-binding domain-containing protein [Exidia glandulosa HHB12029]
MSAVAAQPGRVARPARLQCVFSESPQSLCSTRSQNPNPSKVLGVFGLSIRTTERDLEDEFGRFGHVEKVTIVYDQRSDRSRGFGFIQMGSPDEAARCIEALNGVDLNGRRIRVDYSVTERAHAPTPGEYMGHRRPLRDERDYRDRDRRDDRYRDRDRDYRDRDHRSYDRDRRDRRDDYGRDRDNWRERDRRSPPPRRHSRSPPPRRRSYSRSPPPRSPRKEYGNGDRW